MMVTPRVDTLRAQRIAHGMSQHRLTICAGLSWGSICRIENGETKRTNLLRAKVIADALGCKVDDLFDVPGGTP